MGAPKEYYVDPAGGNDTTGNGTIGTPWKSVQKALNTITRDATNGDRVNIKAGVADVLGAALSFSTYGVGGLSSPLIFQGYTAVAGDGGIGSIDGAGAYAISAGNNYTFYRDLKLGNCGAAAVVNVGGAGGSSHIINCEVYGTSGNGIVSGNQCYVDGCYVHDIGGIGFSATGESLCLRSHFENGVVAMTACVSGACRITNWNTFNIAGATNAIITTSQYNLIAHNSILSSGGTGTGITASTTIGQLFEHNLIEGFSGVGGRAIYTSANSFEGIVCRNNSIFNCTAGISSVAGYDGLFNRGNETLVATPFAKIGANTWANRLVYYAPQNVGSVYGGSGDVFRGAIQPVFTGGTSRPRIYVGGRLRT